MNLFIMMQEDKWRREEEEARPPNPGEQGGEEYEEAKERFDQAKK
jgi:hypothetical protein